MNFRFDSSSIRIRVSEDEALKLQSVGSLVEIYPVGRVKLELYLKDHGKFGLDDTRWPDFRFGIPKDDLCVVLGRIDSAQLKKNAFSIRETFKDSQINVDLIFEIDFFNRKKETLK